MQELRAATERDLPGAAALSAAVGWNQVAADWAVFLESGAVRVLEDGEPCLAASAALLPHGPGLAWISMVLVRPDRRREGLATALMRWAMAAGAGIPCLALDATPAGREVYARLGFRDVSSFARWSLPHAMPRPAGIRPIGAEDWPAVFAMDHAALGAPRESLLRGFAARMPRAALITDGGFVLARDGLRAPQIGPVVADTPAVALALIAAARHALGTPCILDTTEAIGRGLGAEMLRPFTRMALGAGLPGQPAKNFVLAGPEFG